MGVPWSNEGVARKEGKRGYQITLRSALLEGRGYQITLMSALFKVKDIKLRLRQHF
jgi:hypothetical protein